MRNLAKELAGKYGAKNIVIDVAAGIGCQVISSIVGVDKVVVVVEPSTQSIEGAKRILELTKHFKIKSYLIVNKFNLNQELSRKIDEILNVEVIGYIPYDYSIVKSYTMSTPILKLEPNSSVSKTLTSIFDKIL